MKVRTRFAPSPTGFVHVGNVYSAMLDYCYARKYGGQFILRIEDTDQKRLVKNAEDVIYQAFDWLGLKLDEGPRESGPYAPYRQSERLTIYQKHASELIKKGQAYYCFCSPDKLKKAREESRKRGQPPMYDRCCRDINFERAEKKVKKGEPHVIRMKIPDNETIVVNDLIRGRIEFDSNLVDDQVLLKSDGFPTYHLAAIVDDHLMKISHVVRGEEWLSSAPKHVLLYRYFGWREPVWFHTPIIRNPDRSKMSKREGHAFISWYQKKGYLPEALLNYLALLAWSHPQEKDIFSLKEYIKVFDLKDVSPIGPVFDLNKLTWMNGMYIRKKSKLELFNLLKSHIPEEMDNDLAKKTIPLVKDRLGTLSDYPDLVDFFIKEPKLDIKLVVQKGKTKQATLKALSMVVKQLSVVKDNLWRHDYLEKVIRKLHDEQLPDWTTGQLFMSLRVVITGKTATPPLFETMEVLGKKVTLKRLITASQNLK